MEMLFIVTLFAAITKTRFSGLKWSSATILFHTYRKFDVNLPKTSTFCKKNASFIENNLPFMGIMFLSRKEAKGSSFRCLAIPVTNTPECVHALWEKYSIHVFINIYFISSPMTCLIDLIIFVYLSSLPVAHLSDAPRRQLVVTGDSARIQDETTENSA